MVDVSCPSCRSQDLDPIGTIPSAVKFAGRELDTPLPGGTLYACRVCKLHFRYPRHNKEILDQLYAVGASDNWARGVHQRKDWLLAHGKVNRFCPNGGAVLDIGCYDGRFLQHLNSEMGGKFDLYGIEIHAAAAERAKQNGVQIIGSDFDAIGLEARSKFDVVTAIDMIEHVHDPLALLEKMTSVTKERGIIFISTGNTAARSWKIMGAQYWYCTIGEHIAFINPEWLGWACDRVGLRMLDMTKFPHGKASLSRQIKEFRRNMRYRKRMAAIGDIVEQPPKWKSAKDHIACVLQKR